LEFVLHKPQLQ